MPRKKKFKKRANNSGSIIKLKGNRRRPYTARVTLGRDENGRPIRKNLAFFSTRQEASYFLDMYNLMKKKDNHAPISDMQAKMINEDLYNQVMTVRNMEKDMLTFKEIFKIIYETRYRGLKSAKSKKSWFNNLKKVHDKPINNITLFELQDIFDDLKKRGRKSSTLSHMKIIVSDIFEFAVIHQYIDRNDDYSSYLDISTNVDKSVPKRNIFSFKDIEELINNHDTDVKKFTLLFIFTGCRPIELFEIDTSKIYIDVINDDDGIESVVSYMITGSKTESGRDRIIPIHDTIKPIIKELLEEHPQYLIYPSDIKNKNHKFRLGFDKLYPNHTPYDCRHTFSTIAKMYKVDTFARKRIMGHKSKDITDDIYTHTLINQLYSEIHKIKVGS